MSMPTQMSLVGFIASIPELHFTKAGDECCRMRVGIEQWRKEVDGSFTELDPTFHDMVSFESTARETYARFRKGDSFVASGYVRECELEGHKGSVIKEELVARMIGHNVNRPTTSSSAAGTPPTDHWQLSRSFPPPVSERAW
jgi:single-strand DNA-binding protein